MNPVDESPNVSSTAFDRIRRRLLQAGKDNVSTRKIVEDHKPNTISHDAVLDPSLQLTLLHIAAWTGDEETIREFPNNGDPSAKTAGGFTALHLAASRGHSNALRELLHWPGLNALSVEGFTALHLAAYGGNHESVRLLLDVSDVNAKDKAFGRTALHFAAQWGHEEVVGLLTGVSSIDVCSKDEVRDLTPFLLAAMQPKGRCSLRVVKRLLDVNAGQINDKVEVLTDKVFSSFFYQPWRELAPIEIDNSMRRLRKPGHGMEDEVNENELDLYRRFAVPMEGHTALHLAATQNNAKLVQHLATRTGVEINEGDTLYGMTPLHCAIRAGAMNAFSALVAVPEVNVNAKLVAGGWCQRPAWLPPTSAFYNVPEYELHMFSRFQQYDTPLHLAIRVCEAADLLYVMIQFYNHPSSNLATCNISVQTPLELAWERMTNCARLPPSFKFRKNETTDSRFVQLVQKYEYDGTAYLNKALDLLERHPSNETVMNEVAEQRKEAQSSVNAFLVTATLLAGLTFTGYLQPPFGTDVGVYKSRAARLFWTFNSLSFYFAVYTILRSLLLIMRSDPRSEYLRDRLEFLAAIRIQTAVPLIASVGFGVGAFAAAGYGNLPLGNERLMLVCTITGLLLVLFELFRNLYIAQSTVPNLIIRKSTMFSHIFKLSRSQSPMVSIIFLLGPISVPFLLCARYGVGFGGAGKIHTFRRSVSNYVHIGFLGIQMYGLLAVVLYGLLEG